MTLKLKALRKQGGKYQIVEEPTNLSPEQAAATLEQAKDYDAVYSALEECLRLKSNSLSSRS